MSLNLETSLIVSAVLQKQIIEILPSQKAAEYFRSSGEMHIM